MTTPQRNIAIATSISLVIHLFALWSNAAYYAGDIGFNEELTWQRMLAAYRATTLCDVARLETIPMGVVAVAGMLAALVFAFIRHWTFPTWGLSLYVFALLLAGGWKGLFALVFVSFDTLDGEFLADSVARITAVGMWAAFLLAALVHRIVKSRKSPNQSAAANRRPTTLRLIADDRFEIPDAVAADPAGAGRQSLSLGDKLMKLSFEEPKAQERREARRFQFISRTRFPWTRNWGKCPGGRFQEMGNMARDERSEERGRQPGETEGGRSPTGVAPGGAAGTDGSVGPLKPGERWTTTRKRDVVIRLLRGESVEALSRELSVESYRLQEWYDRAMASLEVGLKERGGGDPVELQFQRAQAMVGEWTMRNGLYQERLRRVEHRPFDPKRSRR